MRFGMTKWFALILCTQMSGAWAHAEVVADSLDIKSTDLRESPHPAASQVFLGDSTVTVPLSTLGATPEVQNRLQIRISEGHFKLRGSLNSTPKGGMIFKGPKSELEKLKGEINRLLRKSGGDGCKNCRNVQKVT